MEATKYIWINGQLVPWTEAKVHAISHTLHYGGGAFEGIRAYKTATGTAIFRLQEHIERLFYSSQAIQLALPYKKEEVMSACQEVVRANGLEQGYLRPIAMAGYGVMSVSPEKAPVDLIIACWPWGAYLPVELADLKISKYPRTPACSTITDAKLTGNYLNGILATNELRGTKYHEILLLDVAGHLAEGSGENIFLVKDGKLLTPKRGSILPGITRDTVFNIAARQQLQVQEIDLVPHDAFTADEAFFTGTAAEIAPIGSIDDHLIGSGQVGPITKLIRQSYLDIVYGRNAAYENFLARC